MPENADNRATLVSRLYAEVVRCMRAVNQPASDDEMSERVEELFAVVTHLAQAPVQVPWDLGLKLAVLCGRLREGLDPEDRGAVLTYLLAELIRDDDAVMSTAQQTSR